MVPGDKLYTVVRADLPPGYQMAQAAHAALRFAQEHKAFFELWMDVSEYICFLSIPTEDELFQLYAEAIGNGIRCTVFREPDLEYELTAVTFEPTLKSKGFLSHLPLALRNVK